MSRITDLKKLELGQLYWIITDSQWTAGAIDLNYLKICNRFLFVDIITRPFDENAYIFIDPLNEKYEWSISEFSVFFIFSEIDSFYRYIYEAVQGRLGSLMITSEVKKVFKESQERNPQLWI